MAGLDDSGGSVMKEMIALFTPPGRETKTKLKKLDLHPYYKRPGKGHNHDSCDACGEGGDLICCDNCPASFHFSCHEPPLEEDDIPMGDWTCLKCYHRDQLRLAAIGAQVNTNLVGLVPAGNGNSDTTTASAGEHTPLNDVIHENGAKSKGKHSRVANKKQMEAVMKAEREKKFKLYQQKYDVYLRIKPLTNSPFDALIAASQVCNAEQFKLPPDLEVKEALPFSWKWSEERQDDFDTYPKSCYACRKTSRGVPAIGCDFCSNIFHLDCLDPPLCEIPKERWMCPNHVEHFLDSNLVASTSLTERMKIWQKYARAPVNPDTVRLEFFRKVRTGKLYRAGRPARIQKPPEFRIKVPSYVKEHYKNRVETYPMDNPNILKSDDSKVDPKNLDSDQKEWLMSVISLQTSILSTEKEIEANGSIKNRRKLKRKSKKRLAKNEETKNNAKDGLVNGNCSVSSDCGDVSDTCSVSSMSTASECSLQLDEEDDEILSKSAQDELREYLAVHRKSRQVDSLDANVVKFLAAQKLNELFPKAATPIDTDCEVRARAALIPLYQHSHAQPCLMRYRTLDIGLGGKETLDLTQFNRQCDFVSDRHATIFFDQYSRVFELINYSEHGTVVDSIIYTLDKRESVANRKLPVRMSPSTGASQSCMCAKSPAELTGKNGGCEATAVLRHGSYLQFGCLKFVFTILDGVYDEELETSELENLFKNAKKMDKVPEGKEKVPEEKSTKDANGEKVVTEQEKKTDEEKPMDLTEITGN